ncbi:MAG TPA: chaperone modulator CbpM [Candidatus Dormibacteraeota bacterium]|nr:chaperone modulator CbpM [Candidatus Dormibacteraeota bacterium]
MVPENDLLRQLARSTGLTRTEIRHFVDLDVLLVGRGHAEATLMRRLRRARRLRRDLGLSLDAVAIILRLLDRIEALQQAQAQR